MSSLYLSYFGLQKPPFQITPDLEFFFAGGRRGDMLTALLHVAAQEEGIITVVAEVGSGKTLLARLMISRLPPQVCAVYLANPSFGRNEILGAIARDLGLSELPTSTEFRLAALQQELLRRHATGQRVLLVIDEAHAMPAESLEEVRLLSNLETGQHKLVNIMLFGQPELDVLLAEQRLRQVRDRVVHRFKLAPLSAQDVGAYVDHRLRAAGWQGGALFSVAAMARLIKASGGRARRINLLADKALLAAYAQGLGSVLPRQVKDAASELPDDFDASPRAGLPAWLVWALFSVGLAVCLTALAVGVLERQRMRRVPVVANPPAASAAPVLAPSPTPAASAVVVSASVPLPARPASAAPVPAPLQAPASAPALPPPQATAVQPVVATAPLKEADSAVSPPMLVGLQPYLQRTEAYLRRPDLGGFTLQIAALPIDKNVLQYLKIVTQQVDVAMVFVQLSHYNGRDFVSIFAGQYASFSEAHAALVNLPADIKTHKPMVRTWTKIRQDQ